MQSGGLRIKNGKNKKTETGYPLISIITCVYNNKNFIEKTILSIISQTYENIEYIIVDGNSTDGTCEIIKQYEDKIDYWVSEPDSGVYDAMNKGINLATGDYLLYINSGDEIYSPDTIRKVFKDNNLSADIYYGESLYIGLNGKALGLRSKVTPHQLPESLNWKQFSMGMVVCHQSFIVKKKIVSKYDLRFRCSSDIDWEIKCIKNSNQIINTHLVLSRFLIGGLSKKFHLTSLTERYHLLKRHFGTFSNLVNHFKIAMRAVKRGSIYLSGD